MKMSFIKVEDKELADKMTKIGYQMIGNDNGVYTFLNSNILYFSEEDKKKIVITDKLDI